MRSNWKAGECSGTPRIVGLLLVRHRRLDRLDPADDLDPVALGQQVVEGRAVEVLGGQAGDERLGHVQGLDRHRLVVGQPQPLRDHDPLGGRDVEAAAEIRAGVRHLERERPAPRAQPAAAHLLAERRHRQLLRDLRLADVRAAAAPADEIALARKLVDRRPHGQPRDAEIVTQLPLGRDRAADADLLDQVEYLIARLALLRRPLRARRHRATHPRPGRSELVNTNLVPGGGRYYTRFHEPRPTHHRGALSRPRGHRPALDARARGADQRRGRTGRPRRAGGRSRARDGRSTRSSRGCRTAAGWSTSARAPPAGSRSPTPPSAFPPSAWTPVACSRSPSPTRPTRTTSPPERPP